MAECYKTLQGKAIRGKAHERRTGICKLPQFTVQMNQFVTFLLNLAGLRPRQRGLETTYPLHVIGRCLGTPKFKGERDD